MRQEHFTRAIIAKKSLGLQFWIKGHRKDDGVRASVQQSLSCWSHFNHTSIVGVVRRHPVPQIMRRMMGGVILC